MTNAKSVSVKLGDKTLILETGRLALQASGSVLATYGDVSILATAGMTEEPREDVDFFPMMVDFEAKFYATGKMKSSKFMKRETRPSESAILTARMVDRPLRPLFPKGMKNDVQIICTLLQTNGENTVSETAINAASMAVQLAGMPIEAPVGAVRIGMKEDGSFYLDPTFDEIENGKLDLILAGTEDAILMMEAGANLISNEIMIKAIAFGHEYIKKICAVQKEFVKTVGIKKKEPSLVEHDEKALEALKKVLSDKDFDSISGKGKDEIKDQIHSLEEKLLKAYAEKIENEELKQGDLMYFFEKKFAESLRRRVLTSEKRIDGRKLDEVRPLKSEVGIFPRLHGSALFQRGETQALSITTVGGPGDVLIINDPERNETKSQYMHHYNFPPYAVGEIKPLRGTNRREVGHGMLAERALKYVLPTRAKDEFPYTVRVVSEILTCNGSSSMASVCGSTLTLMDAGIPIKRPIAGVAMGVLVDEEKGNYKILTDIMSFEDFCGDMDFKVTGDDQGITALQLDMKVKGLDLDLLKQALDKAQIARKTILANMKEAIAEPRKEMSSFAPRIDSFHINTDYIRIIIGKGGETIQGLCADYNVKIDIEDDGLIMITSTNQENAKAARAAIDALVYEPKTGDIFEGKVKSIQDFGVFVEFLPGKEALVHVSEMANRRVGHPSEVVKEGDKVKVKIMGTDKMGRTQLSMREAEK